MRNPSLPPYEKLTTLTTPAILLRSQGSFPPATNEASGGRISSGALVSKVRSYFATPTLNTVRLHENASPKMADLNKANDPVHVVHQ
jgi:hypothetical protein